MREKFLSGILGVMLTGTAPPDERIDGKPVNAAKPFQSDGREGRIVLSNAPHYAPMGGVESAGFNLPGFGISQNKCGIVGILHCFCQFRGRAKIRKPKSAKIRELHQVGQAIVSRSEEHTS